MAESGLEKGSIHREVAIWQFALLPGLAPITRPPFIPYFLLRLRLPLHLLPLFASLALVFSHPAKLLLSMLECPA